MLKLRTGDEVAILPNRSAPAEKVSSLAIVSYAGSALIELDNGRLYFVLDGRALNSPGCIVPANEQHRAEILRRTNYTG